MSSGIHIEVKGRGIVEGVTQVRTVIRKEPVKGIGGIQVFGGRIPWPLFLLRFAAQDPDHGIGAIAGDKVPVMAFVSRKPDGVQGNGASPTTDDRGRDAIVDQVLRRSAYLKYSGFTSLKSSFR